MRSEAEFLRDVSHILRQWVGQWAESRWLSALAHRYESRFCNDSCHQLVWDTE